MAARIRIITPAGRGSRSGNRNSAERWARFLRSAGYRVDVSGTYNRGAADLMVALHAWRSAGSIRRFRERYPERPLVVVLTGTDLYGYLASDPETTLGSLERADRLVALHGQAAEALPEALRPRLRIIPQSAKPPPGPRQPTRRWITALVLGHLREVKDPLLPARAARLLPHRSRIRIRHLGRASDAEWAAAAAREDAATRFYRWVGERPQGKVRRYLARAHFLIHPSRTEGGAHAVIEAVVAGVPVLASDIPGNTGLLGREYPGLFPAGDEGALAGLLQRAETDPDFRADLERRCATLALRFTPEREAGDWQGLVAELLPAPRHP